MADTAFIQDQGLAPDHHRAPRRIDVSPAVVDALITLGGAVLFASAGVLLGFYLMLPFDLG
jgi:hypothetical protein